MTPISLSSVIEAPGSTGLGALRCASANSGPPSAFLRAALSPPQPIPKNANAETNRATDFGDFDFMNTLGREIRSGFWSVLQTILIDRSSGKRRTNFRSPSIRRLGPAFPWLRHRVAQPFPGVGGVWRPRDRAIFVASFAPILVAILLSGCYLGRHLLASNRLPGRRAPVDVLALTVVTCQKSVEPQPRISVSGGMRAGGTRARPARARGYARSGGTRLGGYARSGLRALGGTRARGTRDCLWRP